VILAAYFIYAGILKTESAAEAPNSVSDEDSSIKRTNAPSGETKND
jgi:hypothetical protein